MNALFAQRVVVGLGFGNKLAQRQFGGSAAPGEHAVIDRDHVGLRGAPASQPRIVFNQIGSSGQTGIAWAGERIAATMRSALEALAPVVPEAVEVGGGAKFIKFGVLPSRQCERVAITPFSCHGLTHGQQ
jgi:hypothetical protein